MTPRQEWCIVRWSHFDPLWRRCWDRPFDCDGRRYVSYRDIEAEWYDRALAETDDGASTFLAEACWTTRHYLERRPEALPALRRLAREGRFEQLAGGENIVDGNMVHGELLARNYILGLLWAEDTFGVRPTTGWHSDGFGSSAQMPQIFRGVGITWVPALSYNIPTAPFWRGLDGSVIFWHAEDAVRVLPFAGGTENMNTYKKHAPCTSCGGSGCVVCAGKGTEYERIGLTELRTFPDASYTASAVVCWLWGEEVMPGQHVEEAIADLRAAHPDVTIRQGTYAGLRPHVASYLAQMDDPPATLVSTKVEHNPAQTGCLTTRIDIKLGHRAAEHLLLAAETLDTLLLGGRHAALLRDQWKRMTLSGFHDSITSTHVDPAYDELCDLQAGVRDAARTVIGASVAPLTDGAADAVTVVNPRGYAANPVVTVPLPDGWPGARAFADGVPLPVYGVADGRLTFLAADVPALGARTVTLEAADLPEEELTGATEVVCGPFTIHLDARGISALYVDGIGDVLDREKYLLAEPVLEVDEGDAWSTRNREKPRTRLAPYTKLERVTRVGDAVTVTTRTRHPRCDDPLALQANPDIDVTYLEVRQQFLLRAGCPYLEVVSEVDWYAGSRKLRLAFPTTTDTDRGLYEIPFGALERDRYEIAVPTMTSGCGEWPALQWGAVRAPGYVAAVLNQGTPGYRVEDGTLFVSILRSPQMPSALLEPATAYRALNFAGMADAGTHCFRHALLVLPADARVSTLARHAETFNAVFPTVPGTLTAPLPGWGLDAADALLVTVKPAERGTGTIVRLVEMGADGEWVTLTVPPTITRAVRTNLLEEPEEPLTVEDGRVRVYAGPWKIVTLRCE